MTDIRHKMLTDIRRNRSGPQAKALLLSLYPGVDGPPSHELWDLMWGGTIGKVRSLEQGQAAYRELYRAGWWVALTDWRTSKDVLGLGLGPYEVREQTTGEVLRRSQGLDGAVTAARSLSDRGRKVGLFDEWNEIVEVPRPVLLGAAEVAGVRRQIEAELEDPDPEYLEDGEAAETQVSLAELLYRLGRLRPCQRRTLAHDAEVYPVLESWGWGGGMGDVPTVLTAIWHQEAGSPLADPAAERARRLGQRQAIEAVLDRIEAEQLGPILTRWEALSSEQKQEMAKLLAGWGWGALRPQDTPTALEKVWGTGPQRRTEALRALALVELWGPELVTPIDTRRMSPGYLSGLARGLELVATARDLSLEDAVRLLRALDAERSAPSAPAYRSSGLSRAHEWFQEAVQTAYYRR